MLSAIAKTFSFFLFRARSNRLFRLRIAFESFRRFPNFCISRNDWADRRCLYRWRWSSNNFSIIGRLIGARMIAVTCKICYNCCEKIQILRNVYRVFCHFYCLRVRLGLIVPTFMSSITFKKCSFVVFMTHL